LTWWLLPGSSQLAASLVPLHATSLAPVRPSIVQIQYCCGTSTIGRTTVPEKATSTTGLRLHCLYNPDSPHVM
jgi:hypothetical protein